MPRHFRTHSEDGELLAVCADGFVDPDIFFDLKTVRKAVQICNTCPLKKACAEYAINEKIEFGVWGGLTESDRRFNKKTTL